MLTLTNLVDISVVLAFLSLLFSRHLHRMIVGFVLLILAFGQGWPLLDVMAAGPGVNLDQIQALRAVWGSAGVQGTCVAITLGACLVVNVVRWRRRSAD